MKNTLELLDKALEMHPSPYWVKQLNLSRNALHSSRQRGNLSPAVAGALAEAMGLDPVPWIAIAALEGEKDSACKSRMVRRFLGTAALAGSALTAAIPASAAPLLGAFESGLCVLC